MLISSIYEVKQGIMPDSNEGVDSNKEVVVKKLERSTTITTDEFKNEVQKIMKLKDENILELVGFCEERQKGITERLLCYKYVPNHKQSLQEHLFGM